MIVTLQCLYCNMNEKISIDGIIELFQDRVCAILFGNHCLVQEEA